jgi:hypothetical protein
MCAIYTHVPFVRPHRIGAAEALEVGRGYLCVTCQDNREKEGVVVEGRFGPTDCSPNKPLMEFYQVLGVCATK